MLSYLVYCINTVYSVKESVLNLCSALRELYATKTLVFTTRNTYPLSISSSWQVDGSIHLIYSPETHSFHARHIHDRKTLDCVTAEVKLGGKVYDLSSFFYSVKWYDSAPSLYELVVLFFMEERMAVGTEVIDDYTLSIMDSSGDTHDIPLSAPLAKEPFESFVSDPAPVPDSSVPVTSGTGLKVD